MPPELNEEIMRLRAVDYLTNLGYLGVPNTRLWRW